VFLGMEDEGEFAIEIGVSCRIAESIYFTAIWICQKMNI
jgi:hypothetical protein